MDLIKTKLNQYFWLIAPVTVIALCIFGFWLLGKYETSKLNSAVQSNNRNANAAAQSAVNSSANAANYSIERRTEDSFRQKVIAPKLDAARKNSQNSKAELEKAKTTYENEKNNPQNHDASDADNCAELVSLFPNVRFTDCQ